MYGKLEKSLNDKQFVCLKKDGWMGGWGVGMVEVIKYILHINCLLEIVYIKEYN